MLFYITNKCSHIETETVVEYKNTIEYVPAIDTIVQTNTVREFVRDTITIKETILDTIIDTIIQSIPIEDMAKIVALYYNKNFYLDSIPIDTIGFVLISDTIQKNRIINRKFEYDIRTKCEQTQPMFLSVGIKTDLGDVPDLGGVVMFTNRQRLSLGYQYGVINNSHNIFLTKSIWNK